MTDIRPERAARTRTALLNAGFELMADSSVEAIPIDTLISTAGVGKGSFFNHFGDKEGFKAAVAMEIRGEIEAKIGKANENVTDPLERLAGGMREVTNYALSHRSRTLAMLRMTAGATTSDYPLNDGVVADVDACLEVGRIRAESSEMAMLYWLGLCVALVTFVVENDLSREQAANRLREMLLLALIGLGVPRPKAGRLAESSAKRLSNHAVLL
ncbi:MAG: TetR/AcrR family transcriptional regulator [Pseudomonadota bacterium]